MFIVLELQNSGSNVVHLFNTYNDQPTAEQKYHTVLASAAVSNLPSHSALLMDEDGNVLRSECYHHEASA